MRTVPIDLVTATGVVVSAIPASIGRRTLAWFLDLIPFIIIKVATQIVVVYFGAFIPRSVVTFVDVVIGGFFLLFYHIYFEFMRDGRTPGKRIMGIRVIDRSGGPVRFESAVLRNMIRSWEILAFLFLLLVPAETILLKKSVNDTVLIFVSLLSVPVLITMPFWNRHVLRIGDLASRTMVIEVPRPLQLRRDLAAPAEKSSGVSVKNENTPASSLQFTKAQLDVYGVKEVQLLEELLRDRGRNQRDGTLREVERTIKIKIGWTGPDNHSGYEFLTQYYAAVRAHLESRMILGRAKQSSRDTTKLTRRNNPPPGGGDSN